MSESEPVGVENLIAYSREVLNSNRENHPWRGIIYDLVRALESERARAVESVVDAATTDDPELDDVRGWYIDGRRVHNPFASDAELVVRFDRWLTAHDAAIRADRIERRESGRGDGWR